MKIKKDEIKDIVLASLGIALCFVIVLNGFSIGNILNKNYIFNFSKIISTIIISLVIACTAFIFHELGHRQVAIYYKAKARFVMWPMYLIISIFFAFITGFIFIAPGAVYIYNKHLSIKENGIVSWAGPLINTIIAFIFLLLLLILQPLSTSLLSTILSYGIFINLWIAGFNLLPFGPLDGKKIIHWNIWVWLIHIGCVIYLLFSFML